MSNSFLGMHSGSFPFLLALALYSPAFTPRVALGENRDPSSPSTEPELGFTNLIASGDLSQWDVDTQVKSSEAQPNWRIVGDRIVCRGQGYGFLRLKQRLCDFVVKMEVLLPPNGNSGVCIRADRYRGDLKTRPSLTGYEIQLIDDHGKPPDTHSSGSLYRYIAPTSSEMRPAGEWNQVEIRCQGPRIQVALNGKKLVNADQSAAGTLKDKPLCGYLMLQSHGTSAEFRDVRLKVITDAPNSEGIKSQNRPTASDFKYGLESEQQRLDYWQAKSDRPTPLVLIIHGGGWERGDKSQTSMREIKPLLENGISVATINYRLIPEAMEQGVEPPVKACIQDAARALQSLRSKAAEWNIDSRRVAASGSSAGACTALWLALHDDLTDPKSPDPVLRESTRLSCAAVLGAQTSLDPIDVRRWIRNANYGGHAFGFKQEGDSRRRPREFALLLENRAKLLPWIKEYSPIEHVSADDPPIFLEYPKQKTPPVIGQDEPDPTHSAIYGVKLVEKLEKSSVEAVLSYPGKEDVKYGTSTEFLIRKLAHD